MEYLELHLNRVQESYAVYSRRGWDFWTVLLRLKAKKTFTNTRALRMIMVFHHENKADAGQDGGADQGKAGPEDELAPIMGTC